MKTRVSLKYPVNNCKCDTIVPLEFHQFDEDYIMWFL